MNIPPKYEDVVAQLEAERLRADVAAADCNDAERREAALREELDQCGSMAAMIENKEWAEHAGTGPVSSRVESAFTQLHNELAEAQQRLTVSEKKVKGFEEQRRKAWTESEWPSKWKDDKNFKKFATRITSHDAHGTPYEWQNSIPCAYLDKAFEAYQHGLSLRRSAYASPTAWLVTDPSTGGGSYYPHEPKQYMGGKYEVTRLYPEIPEIMALILEIEALRDQVGRDERILRMAADELVKDAARYRWLMSGAVLNGVLGIPGGWIDFEFKDEASQQIDEAMHRDAEASLKPAEEGEGS